MTILTFPAVTPAKSTWGIKSLTETFTSPLNGSVQTAGRPGARWKATLEFAQLALTEGATVESFLAQMDGMAGRVYLYPHHRPGSGANAAVNGASQVGTTLNLTCAAGRVFAVGDYFTVNAEFKMVTAAATADGAGAVALSFAPMLRASPADAAAVVFTRPTALMMLAQDEYSLTRNSDRSYDGFSIQLIEVFV